MLINVTKQLSIPLFRSSIDIFTQQIVQSMLNIQDATFGFERLITTKSTETNLIIPSNHKQDFSNINEKSLLFLRNIPKNAHFYSILLKNSDFLPIFSKESSCLFDDLYLDSDEDSIFIQLLASYKTNNWQQEMLEQYKSYISGVDEPVKNKWGRFIQMKILESLDLISSNHSSNQLNDKIDQKITSRGYNCELRLAICSDHPEQTINYIQYLLQQYAYLNQFSIHEENSQFIHYINKLTLTHQNFHLSEFEIESLIRSNIIVHSHLFDSQLIQQSTETKNILNDNESILSSYKDVQKALRVVGLITPKYKLNQTDALIGHNVKLISIQIPKGRTFTQFTAKKDDISAALGEEIDIIKGKDPNTISFLFPLSKRKIVTLSELINSPSFKQYAKQHILPLAIGLNLFDKPIYEDLTESPHLLISGATKSGKSVFLNTIIKTLLHVKKTNELHLSIIDPKLIEFNQYKEQANVTVITNIQESVKTLNELVIEMEKRYQLMSTHHVKNIQEYNLNYAPMPYLVCIIDEYYDLYLQNKSIEETIARLGQKARAAGIHLIVATQRPDANVISGVIKTNLTSKISFHLGSNKEYMTVFGKGIPYNLLGNGDGVMNWITESEEYIRFQSPIDIVDDKSSNQIDHLVKLKQIINQTGETRVKELQQKMGIRINLVNDLMKQLVKDGFLYKDNRGYQIVDEE